jgi:hypothetical protein
VTEQSGKIRELAAKQAGTIRGSFFSRDPNGREYGNIGLRVPMQTYNALMQSLSSLGRLENLAVHRDDRPNPQFDEKTAPADITIQVYSQDNVVAEGSGLPATLRRTIARGSGALMWSVRMIGVALAFLAPWMSRRRHSLASWADPPGRAGIVNITNQPGHPEQSRGIPWKLRKD